MSRAFLDHTSRERTELTRALRLTARQVRFAQALSSDIDRNQTRAALAAGASPRRAHITGSEWARSRKVREYMAAIVRAAIQLSKLTHSLDSGRFWPMVRALLDLNQL